MPFLVGLPKHKVGTTLDTSTYLSTIRCWHTGIRMVYFSFNFCIQHYIMLRGHLLRFKQNTQANTLLDQFCI